MIKYTAQFTYYTGNTKNVRNVFVLFLFFTIDQFAFEIRVILITHTYKQHNNTPNVSHQSTETIHPCTKLHQCFKRKNNE